MRLAGYDISVKKAAFGRMVKAAGVLAVCYGAGSVFDRVTEADAAASQIPEIPLKIALGASLLFNFGMVALLFAGLMMALFKVEEVAADE